MTPSLLDRLLSRKGLYAAFWTIGIVMVTTLIVFTANLQKEVPPIPQQVVSAAGETLYTYDDVVHGKGLFQQFALMDYGPHGGGHGHPHCAGAPGPRFAFHHAEVHTCDVG